MGNRSKKTRRNCGGYIQLIVRVFEENDNQPMCSRTIIRSMFELSAVGKKRRIKQIPNVNQVSNFVSKNTDVFRESGLSKSSSQRYSRKMYELREDYASALRRYES